MSKPTLFAYPQSPPSRTVVLCLDALKVDYDYHYVDLFAGDARKPEYIQVRADPI